VHGGAMRVKGGVGAVIEAIAAPLPKARLNLGHRLISVVDRGDHVELTLQQGDTLFTVDARRVVLALPPRVLDATVRFTPELDSTLRTAMRDTPTWMATAAKAGFVYKKAFWQEAGLTGNAWVTHSQAMLAEVFDASGPDADAYPGAALAGFAAMGASQRPAFERSRALLLESQVVQLFGELAANPSLQVTQLWKDWAQDDTTCSPLDVEEENMGGVGHPQYGLPVLAEGHWQGRLYLGGTETASRGGGYLEGALNAAGRLRKQLMAGGLPAARSREAANDGQLDADNDRQLKAFADWVGSVRGHALEHYRERVHTALSQQDADQLTQKAIIAAMEALYAEALSTLQQMPLHTAHQPVEQGRSALTPRVLSPFSGLADELLAEVVIYNRGSCALSNFPFEHKPGGDYLRTIRRDLAAVWQSFALSVNACLLGKREASPDTHGVTA
jgi:monoamine oxidase